MKNFTLPDLVDYPKFFNVREYSRLFNNLYSYVINPYSLENGYSLYIGFRDEYIFVRLTDFKSNELKLSDPKLKVVLKHVDKLANLMKVSKIREACYYFSDYNKPILVDVMISANKFLGPGMVRDVYSKIIPTQEIVEIVVISTENYSKYSGKFIKPSTFKYVMEEQEFRPLYGIMK